MKQPLKVTAICGWGLPLSWFRNHIQTALPAADIRVFYPQAPSDASEAENIIKSEISDVYMGYSMGSLWLLHYQSLLPEIAKKLLISPILGFCQEKGLGGKITATQLKFMIREIQRAENIHKPLKPFYDLCENNISDELLIDLPSRETLLGGLHFLKDFSVSGDSTKEFVAILGDRDPLIDSAQLQKFVPNLEIVANTGHSLKPLLSHLAIKLKGLI